MPRWKEAEKAFYYGSVNEKALVSGEVPNPGMMLFFEGYVMEMEMEELGYLGFSSSPSRWI